MFINRAKFWYYRKNGGKNPLNNQPLILHVVFHIGIYWVPIHFFQGSNRGALPVGAVAHYLPLQGTSKHIPPQPSLFESKWLKPAEAPTWFWRYFLIFVEGTNLCSLLDSSNNWRFEVLGEHTVLACKPQEINNFHMKSPRFYVMKCFFGIPKQISVLQVYERNTASFPSVFCIYDTVSMSR